MSRSRAARRRLEPRARRVPARRRRGARDGQGRRRARHRAAAARRPERRDLGRERDERRGPRESPAQGARTERSAAGSPFRLRLVAHDPDVYRLFYDVVANPVLWFVQHGLWDLKHDPERGPRRRRGATATSQANRALAAAAVEELDRVPEATVFVHDYHLYLVPALVRAARPGRADRALHPHPVGRARRLGRAPARDRARDPRGAARLRQRRLPHRALARGVRRELRGPARAGAPTPSGVSHANPIAVDAAEFEALAAGDGVRARRGVRSWTSGRRSSSCGSTASTRRRTPCGASRRSGACSSDRPGLHGRIGLLALLDPSREEIPEYVDYRRAVEAAAAAVNGRFGRRAGSRSRSSCATTSSRSVAAYVEYDVLLVNPVMDGLNLVAKEAPLVNGRDGVLVLSRAGGRLRRALASGSWASTRSTSTTRRAALERAVALPADRAPGVDRGHPGARADARPRRLGRTELRELAERTPSRRPGATMRP